MQKYPERVPIICEKDKRSLDIPDIDREKIPCPDGLIDSQFYVRNTQKDKNITPDKSIYLFIDNHVMPATGQLISQLYHEHKDEDGFLYIKYAENQHLVVIRISKVTIYGKA